MIEDEVKDTLGICRVGRIWIVPFVDWTDFNKLAEESESGVPSLETVDPNLIDYMEYPAHRDSWTSDDWTDWLMGDEGCKRERG